MDGRTDTTVESLIRHADGQSRAIESITVSITRRSHLLEVSFVARGDIGQLALPPGQSGSRGDDLWRHTCFECFVEAETASGYLEFNLSPSGEWAAYSFTGYRQGKADLPDSPVVRPVVSQGDGVLTVVAAVRIEAPDDECIVIGLSAVEEDQQGLKAYWALAHPEGSPPDFHHPVSISVPIFPLEPA